MKRILVFILFLSFTSAAAFAAVKKKAAAPTPTATAVATAIPTPVKQKKPRWVPWPPIREEARLISYNLSAVYRDQKQADTSAYSVMDIRAMRRPDEYFVSGEGMVRFVSSASPADNVQTVQLRTAKVDLAENWFTLTAGRFNISDQVSTTRYFGRYPFEGLRRVTGVRLFLPVRFLIGVEDYRNVSSPPTSISLYYLPNIFSDIDADLSGQQAFFLGNARARVKLAKKWQTVFLLNYGKSKSNYFQYSSINGSGTMSAAAEIIFDSNYSVYGEIGFQNTSKTAGTEVATFGVSLKRIGTFGPFSVDDVIFEAQKPMNTSLENPFTGGNPVFPEFATTPDMTYYVKVKARVRGVFLEADGTTAVNDYTFARLNHTNVNSLTLPLPIGGGLENDGLEIPFASSLAGEWAMMFRAGVQF